MEKYFDTAAIKGRYQQAVAESVCTALMEFCRQESEFRQAVEQSGKTFQDCLDECIKGVKGSISDIELYRKAVSFYFKGFTLHDIVTVYVYNEADALRIFLFHKIFHDFSA